VNLLKRLDLRLGLVLGNAVGFLDCSRQLIALAGNRVKIFVGQLAPFLLHVPFELFPVAFDHVPIHGASLQR
jgi:hypothetical protein